MESTFKHPGLRCFIQHGFTTTGTSGNQVYGRCPFCGKDRHFYVNPENKAWDCKRCGEKGGFQTFLDKIAAQSSGTFDEEAAGRLVTSRGISQETFEHFGIGYSHLTDTYTVPVWDMKRAHVWDLRFYRDGKLFSTAGCHVGLFGWWGLSDAWDTAYICEGEWDGMAWWEVLNSTQRLAKSLVVAVPGAGTFKAEWATHFKGKKVVVLYDNDKPGRDGSLKVYNLLKASVADLKFVHWSEKHEQGFDIRDLYVKQCKRNAKKALDYVEKNLYDEPPGVEDASLLAKDTKATVEASVAKLDGIGLEAEEVYKAFQRWLLLPDERVLDFMFGVVLANRLPGDPIWAQLVGPSGATKTELLVSLNDSPMIETATSLTPHALVSGANFSGGGDPSLIPQWNGKVVIIKDLTVIMNMNITAREEILSIFRDAYEGHTEKSFGNGIRRVYDSKFGILAGVTPIIEIFTETHTALGERFLRYPVYVPETLAGKMEITRRAIRNNLSEDEMRSDLRATAKRVLTYKFPVLPKIPEPLEEKIIHLSQFVELMRGSINRDHYTKDITHQPFGAFATRISKQFCKLLLGIGMFRRLEVIDELAYEVIKKIAIGTIPSRFHDIVSKLYKKNPEGTFSSKYIIEASHLPSATVQRLIDGLVALGVLKKVHLGGLAKPEYKIHKDVLNLIRTSEVYK